MVSATYACFDGTPFPVEFADAADADLEWLIDLEHAPTAQSPLADAVLEAGRPGMLRAWAECDAPVVTSMHRPRPRANGYVYGLPLDRTSAELAAMGDAVLALRRAHRGAWGVWTERCLPGVRDGCAWLADAPASTPFGALAEVREHVWGLTGVAGVAARVDEGAVAALATARFGDRATLVAYELAGGADNPTMAADRAVAALARHEPGSAAEAEARAAHLAGHGARSTSWTIDHPTLDERTDLLDAQVRALRADGLGADRGDGSDRGRDRRAWLVGEIESTLPLDQRADLHRRLDRLRAFVPVREARAHWQLVATGALRGAVLRRGAELAAGGVLGEPEDVLLLTPDEYDDPSADLRPVLGPRRVELAHWRSITPPASIGVAAATGATEDRRVVRGIAGSTGVAEGPARVIVDLDDADRLRPGDVLVTTMTSPVWTPLFALAAAVVTDAGDDLSHVAIAAREHAIPCVAGTARATAVVPDGARIRVDGDAGTVEILG